MASSKEYLDSLLEQLSELDDVSYRAMMGEAFYIGADGIVTPCQGMCDSHFGKTFPTLKALPLRELLTDLDYVKWNYATVGDVRRGNDECRKCEYIEKIAGAFS